MHYLFFLRAPARLREFPDLPIFFPPNPAIASHSTSSVRLGPEPRFQGEVRDVRSVFLFRLTGRVRLEVSRCHDHKFFRVDMLTPRGHDLIGS